MAANPLLWGPTYWFVIHHAATRDYADFETFLKTFVQVLPCPACSNDALDFIEKNPVYANNHFEYSVLLHNYVNLKLKKIAYTQEDAYAEYEHHKTVCADIGSINTAIFVPLVYSAGHYMKNSEMYITLLIHVLTMFYSGDCDEAIKLVKTYKCSSLHQVHDMLNIVYLTITGDVMELRKAVPQFIHSPSEVKQLIDTHREKVQYTKLVQEQYNNADSVGSITSAVLIALCVILILLQLYIILYK